MAEGYVTDDTGKIKIQWFNQPYMANMYHDGEKVRLANSNRTNVTVPIKSRSKPHG